LWEELADELTTAGMMKQTDRLMLAALCRTYGSWRAASDPGIAEKHLASLIRLAKEFGLTPAARTNVHANPAKTKEQSGKGRFFKIVG